MHSTPTLRRWLAALTTAGVFALLVAVISGQGDGGKSKDDAPWPTFGGGKSRNMVNLVEKRLPVEWDVDPKEPKNVLWVQSLGSKAYGGPIIGDGKIFIGTNNENPRDPKVKGDKGIVMCFDARTGKFLWQRVHDKLAAKQVMDWPKEGICSSPFVEGKKIYYVSNRCTLVCATTDGKDVWELDMIKQLGVFPHNLAVCSPLVVGDLVFTVTANGVNEDHITIPAPAAPSFLAVNKHTGAVVWQNNDPSKNLLDVAKDKVTKDFIKALRDRGQVLMHGQWSNPAYAVINGKPQVIFPGGDGWLRAYEPATGKPIWQFDCNPKSSTYVLGSRGTRNDFISTPVVHDNKVYIGVGQDPEHDEGIGHFWCIDATKTGDVSPGVRVFKAGEPPDTVFDPKAPENKNSALVWHFGGLGDPKMRVGRNYVFGRTMSTAAIADGLVYVGELAGYLHCLDAKTGQRYWYHNLNAPIWTSPLVADGKVYMGSDAETMIVFAHGKEKKILAENDFGRSSALRVPPSAADGTLYVIAENRLYAIKDKN